MIYAIFSTVIVALAGTIYGFFVNYRNLRAKYEESRQDIEKLQKNLADLKDFHSAVTEIQAGKKKLSKKIKEAKTDEEVGFVIGDIIRANNSRV